MTAPAWLLASENTVHVHHRDARHGTSVDWPGWVTPPVREAWARRGVERPWAHQVEAAELALSGRHVAIATGTASGKTLAYLLPVLTAGLERRVGRDLSASRAAGRPGRPGARSALPAGSHEFQEALFPAEPEPGVPGERESVAGGATTGAATRQRLRGRGTALYLAPTKALAHDQWRVCTELGLDGWKVSALDGDSDAEERRYARDFAAYVLSNPDMLHRSILPNHARYARLLGGLAYVVVDEAHRYRGVFGSHVAAVLRRLRRICRAYGSDPTFVVASATMQDPGAVAGALIGSDDVTAVSRDDSPRPALDVVCWRPTPHLTETAARLLARLSEAGQTLAFTTSRLQAELVAIRARELLGVDDGIAAYRGGYLPGDRRSLEAALSDGRLRGVACTNALELGVDISGMDAVISVGFPGTLAAFWQQVGRAGRSGRDAVAVLAAREDPLDSYLVSHPDTLFGRPVEHTMVHTENPYVLGPHLAAAAQERPLTAEDAEWFGPQTVPLAERLAAQGVLRRRPAGWFWTHPQRAADAVDLRAINGKAVEVVDSSTGRVIGQVDPSAADRTVHLDAVYVHQGEQWIVEEYDENERVALARRDHPGYYTQPQSSSTVRVLTTDRSRRLGQGRVHVGTIELATQVIGYLRRDAETGEVWDSTPLDCPARRMTTRATWWTLPAEVADGLVDPAALPGAVHGAEHTAIGLLPLLVPCDRWDIGGLSTVLHPDTGLPTVFVHDGLPGGSGFADLGYERADAWWAATLERLTECCCEDGCPACVVSPKCGNGNNPLDKRGAAAVVAALTADLTRGAGRLADIA